MTETEAQTEPAIKHSVKSNEGNGLLATSTITLSFSPSALVTLMKKSTHDGNIDEAVEMAQCLFNFVTGIKTTVRRFHPFEMHVLLEPFTVEVVVLSVTTEDTKRALTLYCAQHDLTLA